MASFRKLNKNTVLLVGDDATVVPGLRSVSLSGRTAGVVPSRGLNDAAVVNLADINDEGELQAEYFFNANDPVQQQFESDFNNQTSRKYTLRISGNVVNDMFTKTAETVGTYNGTITAASGNVGAKFVPSSSNTASVSSLANGDYIGSDVRVKSVAGSDIFVENVSGTGNVVAVATARDFVVKRPAVEYAWNGFVSSLPIAAGDSSSVQVQSVSIRLSGSVAITRGTPDIS